MNRLKGDFLATMSHELRTPLNSIIGFSDVLADSGKLSEPHRRYVANIQSSARMLLAMINDILDSAKIEGGKMEVRVEEFSVRDTCESAVGAMRPIAERKQIDLECQFDAPLLPARQDARKLRQIIDNLLSNAIKFTPSRGRVTLRASARGESVIVSVRDTGIGIAQADREKVFERFRQLLPPEHADGVLARGCQGTGLGLPIARGLAHLPGGEIGLESQPGQGSLFTVHLPRQLFCPQRIEVSPLAERIDGTESHRVAVRADRGSIRFQAT
jgi:signal transduction histidine kinase